jgi:tRNA-dihydrouridine synthase A
MPGRISSKLGPTHRPGQALRSEFLNAQQAAPGAGACQDPCMSARFPIPDAPSSPRERRGVLRPLSVAPMMDRTDRHFRFLIRLFTRRTLLYTEMVTTGAVRHGPREKLLGFSPEERPLSLQLGGDDARELAEAARLAEELGYDEVNLNVGCPSDRVQSGNFGACLMARPDDVARAVEAMREACSLPVTVKHRIGIDELDSYDHMLAFVDRVARAGCDRFTVHARKAVLGGLSPRENREVPPLRYEDVHRLKAERPGLHVEINGGFKSLAAAAEQIGRVDAVMIGRFAYDEPAAFREADRLFFGATADGPTEHEAVRLLLPYTEAWLARGGRLHEVSRHALGLFAGRPGARAWRRTISESSGQPGAGPELLERALQCVPE